MPKVMLIEDDKIMLSLLETLLTIEGFQVTIAGDDTIDQILNTIRQEKPEVALLDLHLRQGNGLDLLKLMRQDADLAGVRVLMSSGMDRRDECLQAGAEAFILKPYMPDDLINVIRQSLAGEI